MGITSSLPFGNWQDSDKYDIRRREAKFALQTSDLGFWTSFISFFGSGPVGPELTTDTSPLKKWQHWALLVHFPKGEKTMEKIYKFEVGKDHRDNRLKAADVQNVDYNKFEKAMYFGTAETSPSELLRNVDKVSSDGTPYSLSNNNCQTWLREFLHLTSPELNQMLEAKLAEQNRLTTDKVISPVAVACLGLGIAIVIAIGVGRANNGSDRR